MATFNLKSFLSGSARTDDAKAAARRELNDEARRNYGDPRWHREQAALIQESVDLGLVNPEVFAGPLKYQNLGLTDKLIRKTRKGIKVYASAVGGYVDESTITTDAVEASRSPLAWHVVASEDDFLADYADSLQTIVSLAQRAEQIELVRRQLVLLQQAVPSSSPFYVDATITGLTATVLKTAIRDVTDAPRPTGGIDPSQVTVIGRASAIDVISDFTGFGQNTLEIINDQGYLGRYRGARIQRLLNYVDGDGASFMPQDEVWVVSDDAGDFATFGGARVNQWVENNLDKTHTKSRREAGGFVYQPQVVRRIKLAS